MGNCGFSERHEHYWPTEQMRLARFFFVRPREPFFVLLATELAWFGVAAVVWAVI